jgi:hypothetical protein
LFEVGLVVEVVAGVEGGMEVVGTFSCCCCCWMALFRDMWWLLVVVIGAVVDAAIVGVNTTVFLLRAMDEDVALRMFAHCFP